MELLAINSLSTVAQVAQQVLVDHPVAPVAVARHHSLQSMASSR
jgi:hypothetical protein